MAAEPEGLKEKEFGESAEIEMDAVNLREIEKIKKLCALWLSNKVRNQPISSKPDNVECLIGHPTFDEAKTAWKKLATQS